MSEEGSHRKGVVKRELARDEGVVWTARGVTRRKSLKSRLVSLRICAAYKVEGGGRSAVTRRLLEDESGVAAMYGGLRGTRRGWCGRTVVDSERGSEDDDEGTHEQRRAQIACDGRTSQREARIGMPRESEPSRVRPRLQEYQARPIVIDAHHAPPSPKIQIGTRCRHLRQVSSHTSSGNAFCDLTLPNKYPKN